MSNAPRVAVIVLSFNQAELTRRCLESLAKVTYERMEVLVVDNASIDGSADLVQRDFPSFNLIRQTENLGFTGGNNAGIRLALEQRFDAIAILNNDAVVEPDFLERLLEHFDSRTIVTPQIRSLRDRERDAGYAGSFDWRLGVMRPMAYGSRVDDATAPREVTMAGGTCLLFPREAFEKSGVFDEDFFLYYEDVDLLTRMQDHGFRIVYAPAAVIYHDESAGQRVNPVTLYYTTRNRLAVLAKHRERRSFIDRILFFGYFYATRAVYLFRYALSGDTVLLRAMLLGLRDYHTGRRGRADYRW